MNYCPLNILTGYTFLSSTLKVEDIYNVCDYKKYPYFGVCDIHNLHAYPELDKYHNSFNSSPVFGATFKCYLFDEIQILISCYITSEVGYLNLIDIISNFPNGISLNDLSRKKEGLIIVLPIISNRELVNALSNSLLDNYSQEIKLLFDGFNKSFLGIEIYNEQDIVYANSVRSFAKKHDFNLVAFNKHQYINRNDAIGLKILAAIKNDSKLQSKTETGPYFFISEKAISQLYTQEEINNTYLIAKSCDEFKLNIKRGKLLNYDLKTDKKNYIKSLCEKKLYDLNINDERYFSRLNYELDIIEKMGYLDYFLIVQDYVNYAKSNNIPVGPGRGSSAGSLVSYLLGITNVDSIKYDLLFERFLNPMRVSMPDIDIDFADYRRDDIINYLKQKYGIQRVANIVTFQTLGPKASIRDVGRVFNVDNRDINLISNCIGSSSSFKQGLSNNYELIQLYEDTYYKEIIDLARKVEGLPRQSGIHAAGIIINDRNLDASLPVSKLEDGSLITQYEGPFLENQGFLKMDILGLTNLTLIESMTKYIKDNLDSSFNVNNIPLNDSKSFEILNKGLTSGIFQLESSGISKTLKEVNITSFDDIVVTLALYRPGPMENIPIYAKTKNENLDYQIIHPSLKSILDPTYGVIVYQEQIMQIVQIIAGFNLGQADLFRRAISKKDLSKLHSLKNEFVQGAIKNNVEEQIAEDVFNLIERFANYGFNKAHSVSYALITYQMAYIKANYPLAFFASILNNMPLNDFKVVKLRQELSYFDIQLKLPSIFYSKSEMIFKNNSLIISFSKIKGLNRTIINQLIDIQGKKPQNFASFMQYAFEYQIPEAAVISLINAGCFDCYNQSRSTLRNSVSSYKMFYQTFANEGILTRDEMMDFLPLIKDLPEDNILKLDLEFQTLGIILSGSIMEKYKKQIIEQKILTLTEQLSLNSSYLTIAAVINHIKTTKTKKNEKMAILNCQDDSGQIEVVLFPKVYSKYNFWLNEKDVYIFKGTLKKEDNISLICDEITKLENKR